MIERLLKKYWLGFSTTKEKESLLKLLEHESEVAEHLKEDSTVSLSPEKAEETLKNIHIYINKNKVVERKSYSPRFLLKISAAVIILLFMAIGVTKFYTTNTQSNFSESDLMTVHNYDNTHSKNIKLSDNSTIILYSGSKISYHKNYNKKNRTIYLSGKAKFNVAKNKNLPFIVNTKLFSTTALGTIFIVNEHYAKNQSSVELLEGKVVIKPLKVNSKTFKPIYLTPKQSFTLDTLTYITDVRKEKIEKVSKVKLPEQEQLIAKTTTQKETLKEDNTTEEAIVFDKTPLNEVFKKLATLYNVEILYKDSSAGLTFTGHLDGNIDIDQHLKIICQLNELKLTQQQKQFIISK